MSKVTYFRNSRPNDIEMDRYEPIIDAEFDEVRETLKSERSANLPTTSEMKGPVSVGRLCAA